MVVWISNEWRPCRLMWDLWNRPCWLYSRPVIHLEHGRQTLDQLMRPWLVWWLTNYSGHGLGLVDPDEQSIEAEISMSSSLAHICTYPSGDPQLSLNRIWDILQCLILNYLNKSKHAEYFGFHSVPVELFFSYRVWCVLTCMKIPWFFCCCLHSLKRFDAFEGCPIQCCVQHIQQWQRKVHPCIFFIWTTFRTET